MLQSAIFADLQVNNFGIPTVRFASPRPVFDWAWDRLANIGSKVRRMPEPSETVQLSAHLRRDIGLDD